MTHPPQTRRNKHAVARLARLLASEPRAWSRGELVDATSEHTITAALRADVAVHAAPGLYVATEHRTHPKALVDVASKWAAPEGAVGGAAALWVHGLLPDAPARITIIAPHVFKRAPLPFAALRRFTITIPHQGVGAVTTVPPADAVIQAWAELEPARRVGVILNAMRMGRLDAEFVGQRLAAYPRVRGRSALQSLLAEFGAGATSFLEHRARTQVFAGPEFGDIVWQAPVVAQGRKYVVDMFEPAARLAVELDGRTYHGDNVARLRDLERDAHLATVGVSTLRLTYDDIMRRPEWCRRVVLLALRARAGRSTSIEEQDRRNSPLTG